MIPGGESTTLLNLMRDEPWFEALRRLHAAGAVAGRHLRGGDPALARGAARASRASASSTRSSSATPAAGRWTPSRRAWTTPALGGADGRASSSAPRASGPSSPSVEVLARYAGEPVLVRQGRVLAATFHPELTRSRALHRYLARMAPARTRLSPASRAIDACADRHLRD